MYKKILVPLDGSAFSERALPLAETLAHALDARLILLRVVSGAASSGVDPTEAQAYLTALETGVFRRGVACEIATPYGDAADGILMEAALQSADLIVMCTHGRSGLGRWIYGSVAEQVVNHSTTPVLLVRPTGEIPTLAAGPEPLAVLVPLDGSPFAEATLPHAEALARALDARLLLLRALEPPVVTTYEFVVTSMVVGSLEEQRQQAEAYLGRVAGKLRDDGLTVQTMAREGWPADAIVREAVESGAQLIVMATHGRSGVERLLLGNVALEVVRRSLLPVLLVRPGQS